MAQNPECAADTSRFHEMLDATKQLIGRAALILGMAAGPGVAIGAAEAVATSDPALAATEFTNDYPDMDATDCSATYGAYSWCKSNQWLSPRGYGYRNCTDGAAYWANKYTGVDVRGWGNANNWDTAANKYTVLDGTSNAIEPGDIAQSDDGSTGHVGFVVSVTKNPDGSVASFKTAELNKGNAGEYGVYTYTTRDAAGKFDRGSSKDWDHFIDLNGLGKGLNNEPLANAAPTPAKPAPHAFDDLAWYDGSTLWGFQGPGFGTAAGVPGYARPGWAGVGDYDHDGHEDIFWYDPNTTTIYDIRGGDFRSARPLRGPGIGAPVWASSGDFDGNGYRDDLAWYDGHNLYLFTGPNLNTSFWTPGFAAPQWADMGDYNGDGKDDLFWYHHNATDSGTIYELSSTGSGFSGAVPIRGPGLGTPDWAGVGDFDGDGKRNDLAWHSGDTLFTFTGPHLVTSGAVVGYAQPQWADVGRCDSDGKDDLLWYHNSAGRPGTLYCIPSQGAAFGGAHALRPGLGTPAWAAAGDLY